MSRKIFLCVAFWKLFSQLPLLFISFLSNYVSCCLIFVCSVCVWLQARKLEAQLDEQMNSYRRLVSTKGSTKVDAGENDLESGIERLLKQLQQVNSQMQAWVSSGGSEMVSHTLTRHQEILQDLTQVFRLFRLMFRIVRMSFDCSLLSLCWKALIAVLRCLKAV